MLLELRSATVAYGQVVALRELTLEVAEGAIVTIIGANGAGKSTALRAISGLVPLAGGELWFDGERIDGLAPERVVARGIAHVPEGRRVFADMSVEENLRTGAYLRRDASAVARDLEALYARFERLRERRRQRAKTLSGGEQQMLAIGRALMARPRLLLMDEPSMGLAPLMVEQIARIVAEIRAEGVPVVLVEQNAELALSLADDAYVLENGALALAGPAAELHDDAHVRAAYLGV